MQRTQEVDFMVTTTDLICKATLHAVHFIVRIALHDQPPQWLYLSTLDVSKYTAKIGETNVDEGGRMKTEGRKVAEVMRPTWRKKKEGI